MRPDGRKPRVYVTHQSLADHKGGASSVTAWVVQALCEDYDVRLATPDKAVRFESIDALYGTSLSQSQVTHHHLRLPVWVRPVPQGRLKSLRLAGSFRDPVLRNHVDGLIFNTSNEMSFTGPAVNYIHCPIRHAAMVAELYGGRERWMRLANNRAFTAISGYDERSFRRTMCVANGQWTASALHRHYGVMPRVIYPPITATVAPLQAFAERAPGYVCVGRITPEKRTHEAIEVMDRLRDSGFDAHLHIVGPMNHSKYMRRIGDLANQRPYVMLHTDIPRAELLRIMAAHRFGLHMMRNEHFGMAVAEMTAAGLLVFAHRSAGPAEILGQHSPLLFDNEQEAIEIASRIHADEGLQKEVLAKGLTKSVRARFSPEHFMRSISQVAAEVLQREAAT